jgi:Fe-S-cluster containining protein
MQDIVKKEGFSFGFDPKACFECEGRCCIGESGYIWVTPSEIEKIANFLSLKRDVFIKNHTQKVKYKRSLKEIKVSDNNYMCQFFDPLSKSCKIYEVRPSQCRTFPFWDRYKDEKYIEEVRSECPGITLF